MRWYMGYFDECIYFRPESVSLSSRSRFPAFVFCFMFLYFCLVCGQTIRPRFLRTELIEGNGYEGRQTSEVLRTVPTN